MQPVTSGAVVKRTGTCAGFSGEPLNSTSKKPAKACTGPPARGWRVKSASRGFCGRSTTELSTVDAALNVERKLVVDTQKVRWDYVPRVRE